MDDAPATPELVAAVRDAPTPEARAALLGVDFAALVSTRRRFQVQSTALCAGAALVLALVDGFSSDSRSTPGFAGYFAGAGIVVGLVLAAFIISQLVGGLVGQRVSSRVTGFAIVAVWSVSVTAALFTTVSIVSSDSMMAGVLVGSALLPLFAYIGVTSLPTVIRTNHPKTVEAVRVQQGLPVWQTLLGGRTRWLLTGLVLTLAGIVATVVILDAQPLAVLPVGAFVLAADLLSLAVAQRPSPLPWFAVQGGATVAVVALAFLLA